MKLYRLMKAASDGKPLLGSGAMMLGVRPMDLTNKNKRFDVPVVAETDIVHPRDGGLSCFSDPTAIMIKHRNLALWSIEMTKLPLELIAQPVGDPHYHIEPRLDVTLDQFQQLLANTRDLWEQE